MIKKSIACSIFLISTIISFSQVKIGDNPHSIHSNSLLELESTSKTFVLPRMNTGQAPNNPLLGSMIYNTDSNCVYLFNGSIWRCMFANSVSALGVNTGLYVANDSLFLQDNGGTLSVPLLNLDNQMLSIGHDTIFLTNGGFVKLPQFDSTSLSTRINVNKQAIIDTASALRTTINTHIASDFDLDTINEIQNISITGHDITLSKNGGTITLPQFDSTSLSTRIDVNKQAIIDTASALRTTINTHIASDFDIDTINEIQNLSILGNYITLSKNGGTITLPQFDSTSLSTRIDVNKQAIIDTASALRTTINTHIASDFDLDTINEIQNISITGHDITLSKNGGIITLPQFDSTSLSTRINVNKQAIIDTASALRTTINTHIASDFDLDTINEIQNISITGNDITLSKNGGTITLPQFDSTSLSTRINVNKQAIIDTASALRTTINTHIASDFDLDTTNEIQNISITGNEIKLSKNGGTITIPQVDTTSLSTRIDNHIAQDKETQALNGLYKNIDTVILGGVLDRPTVLTSSATNTLAVEGLQSGSWTDSILVADPTSGVLKRISASALGDKTNVRNGLTETANDSLVLGGSLDRPTSIVTTNVNTLAIEGLESGSKADSTMVVNATTGVVKRISSIISSDRILDGTIETIDISNNAITTSKIANAAIDKSKIAADVAGAGLVQDANGSLKVDVGALTGDGSITSPNSSITITGTPTNSLLENVGLAVNTDNSTTDVNSNGQVIVKDNGITSAKILNGTISTADLGQNGASAGNVLEWDGIAWVPVTRVKTVNGVAPTSNGNVSVALSRVTTGMDSVIGATPSFVIPIGLSAPLSDGDIFIVNNDPDSTKNGVVYIYDDSTGWNKVNTDFTANDNRYVNSNGDVMSGTLNMTSHKITGLGTPTVGNDAANKQYVDDLVTNSASGAITSPNSSITLTGIPVNSLFKSVGFDVNVDGSSIEVSGIGKVQVKDAGISTVKIANDAVDKTKIAADVAGTGLVQDVDGSLKVNASAINLAGDVTGTLANSKVEKIQNVAVSSTAPTNNQILTYNTTTSQWEPKSAPADIVTNYTDALTGTKHKIGTYTNENSTSQDINETVNTLSINNGNLVFTNENASNANIGLISGNANNAISAGTDGKLFVTTPTGSETKINAGTNISVTGSGTIASPYVINNTFTEVDGSTTNEIQTLSLTGNTLSLSNGGGSVNLTSGSVTSVSGTAPISVATGTSTPVISLTRNDLNTGASSSAASTPISITNGTNAVVNGSNTSITVNNTAPLWNANLLQGVTLINTVPTNGQVLKFNGSSWAPGTDNGSTEVIGNEVLDATSGMGLIRAGSGTTGSPYTLGVNTNGITSAMILDGTVNSIDIQDATIQNNDILNGTIHGQKIQQMGASLGQYLGWNGSYWTPTTQVAEGDGTIGNEVLDATSGMGLIRAGSGTTGSPYTLGVNTNGITSAMILDGTVNSIDIQDATIQNNDILNGTIHGQKIQQMGASSGQYLGWNGSYWTPTTQVAEVDGIIGNEVLDATSGMGLIRAGSGTSGSPYTLGVNTNGITSSMILDGTVSSTDIQDATIQNNDILNGTIHGQKIQQMGASLGQYLGWNGSYWTPTTQAPEVDGVIGNEVLDATSGMGLIRAGSGTSGSPYTLGVNTNGITSSMILDGTVSSADIASNTISSSNILDGTIATSDLSAMGATTGQILKYNGTTWGPATEAAASNWLMTGNSNATAANFLGTTNDIKMTIRSNNWSMLEFGRRQTLGLVQGYTDYTDPNQPLVHLRGDGTTSALQFAASAASSYKPMFFTTTEGNFRMKGSSAGTDYFELGSGGATNAGRLDFLVADDGNEPMIFNKYNYRNGGTITEMFRMQGAADDVEANSPVRIGVNMAGNIPNSTFQIKEGSFSVPIDYASGTSFAITEKMHTVVVPSGVTASLPLPFAGSVKGRIYVIKNNSGSARTITTYKNMSNVDTNTVANNTSITLQSDGTNWIQIDEASNSSSPAAAGVKLANKFTMANAAANGTTVAGITMDGLNFTVAKGNSGYAEVRLYNNNGSSVTATTKSLSGGSVIQGRARLNVNLLTNSYIALDLDEVQYWDTSLGETLTVFVTINNTNWYKAEFQFYESTSPASTKQIFISVEKIL